MRRKRLTKREIRHDPIIEKTLLAWRYVLRHRNQSITVGMAIVAVGLLAWGISAYGASRRAEAETDLGRAVLAMQVGDQARAKELLEALVSRRWGRASTRASYYLASLKFAEGQFDEARELFDRFSRRSRKDPFFAAAAAKGVADCDAEMGRFREAGEEYRAVATRYKDGPWAPECLYLAGLAFRRAGETRKGIEALELLVESYPWFGQIGQARVLLGELQARERVLG